MNGTHRGSHNRARLIGWGLRALSVLAAAIVGLLALRLLFRVMMANPANPLTTVVYASSRPALFPWDNLWPPPEIPGLVVERATVAALGTYLIGSLVLGLLGYAVTDRQEEESACNSKQKASPST